jgi:hypothetical protein
MSKAQSILTEFATAVGFPEGLPLDEHGTLVFVSDGRLEISVAAMEVLHTPGIAFSAVLGSAEGQAAAAQTVVHVANANVIGQEPAPHFALQDEDTRVGVGMFVPLDNLQLQDFETALGRFITSALRVMDRLAALPSGQTAETPSVFQPEEVWIRV